MKVEIARDLNELPHLAGQWDALVREDPAATVFQTWPWIHAWWNTYGEPNRAFLVFLHADDRLIGIAPLYRKTVGTEDEIAFMGHGRADYLDLIARDADRQRVAEAVFAALGAEPGWSLARLRNIPADSPTAHQLPAAARSVGLWVLRDPDEVCPVLVRDGREPTPEALLRKYRVRRAANGLRRMGRFEVVDLTDVEAARAQLPGFFEQHVRRWQNTPTPSLFLDPQNRQFYEQMVAQLMPTGHLLFTVARLDGRPIACHFGFDFGGRVFWYKPAFDPAFASRSPGTTLLEHLIRLMVDRGRWELDFTIGDEPFKQRYANAERQNRNFRVFRTAPRYVIAQSRDAAYRGLRWIVRRAGLAAALERFRR
jgi:CelD/BcsL family acetyltransferase involved in cellulose biosynthesis